MFTVRCHDGRHIPAMEVIITPGEVKVISPTPKGQLILNTTVFNQWDLDEGPITILPFTTPSVFSLEGES